MFNLNEIQDSPQLYNCNDNVYNDQIQLEVEETINIQNIFQFKDHTFMVHNNLQCQHFVKGKHTQTFNFTEQSIAFLHYFEQFQILLTVELRDNQIPYIYLYPDCNSKSIKQPVPEMILQSLKLDRFSVSSAAFPSQNKLVISCYDDLIAVKGDDLLIMRISSEELSVVYRLSSYITIDAICLSRLGDQIFMQIRSQQKVFIGFISQFDADSIEELFLCDGEQQPQNLQFTVLDSVNTRQKLIESSSHCFQVLAMSFIQKSQYQNILLKQTQLITGYIISDNVVRVFTINNNRVTDHCLFKLAEGTVKNVFICNEYIQVLVQNQGWFLKTMLVPCFELIKGDKRYEIISQNGLDNHKELVNQLYKQQISKYKELSLDESKISQAAQQKIEQLLRNQVFIELFTLSISPEEDISCLISGNDNYVLQHIEFDGQTMTRLLTMQDAKESVQFVSEVAINNKVQLSSNLVMNKLNLIQHSFIFAYLYRLCSKYQVNNQSVLDQLFRQLVECQQQMDRTKNEQQFIQYKLGMLGTESAEPQIQDCYGTNARVLMDILSQSMLCAGKLASFCYESVQNFTELDVSDYSALEQVIKQLSDQNTIKLVQKPQVQKSQSIIKKNLVSIFSAPNLNVIYALYIAACHQIDLIFQFTGEQIIQSFNVSSLKMIDSLINVRFNTSLDMIERILQYDELVKVDNVSTFKQLQNLIEHQIELQSENRYRCYHALMCINNILSQLQQNNQKTYASNMINDMFKSTNLIYKIYVQNIGTTNSELFKLNFKTIAEEAPEILASAFLLQKDKLDLNLVNTIIEQHPDSSFALEKALIIQYEQNLSISSTQKLLIILNKTQNLTESHKLNVKSKYQSNESLQKQIKSLNERQKNMIFIFLQNPVKVQFDINGFQGLVEKYFKGEQINGVLGNICNALRSSK
ncbi:Conserved_hypothetical protein [Hexamita inflata]|uniref:Uncharacterized protein n=1 Tax=Hexamita inflata TaxID=28002 RepID=A0AA86QN00_9EUKA|nr:Conserved hypothetical protein [Hexamita inflata]